MVDFLKKKLYSTHLVNINTCSWINHILLESSSKKTNRNKLIKKEERTEVVDREGEKKIENCRYYSKCF